MSQWNILELSLFFTDYTVEPQLTHFYSFLFLNTLAFKVLSWSHMLLPALSVKTTIVNAIVITVKFVLLIALLVFVRGGIPRYRYDFLTKVGWIKFLSLILAVFLSSLLLIYII